MSLNEAELVFLGTGTSTGVPVIGCECQVCRSDDSHDKRLRPSVMIQLPQGRVLIDTTPDMRQQLLRESISHVDAVLYTHFHADHIFGMDDIRIFPKFTKKPVDIYAEARVQEVLARTFPYAFDQKTSSFPAGFLPKICLHTIESAQPFDLLGARVLPIRLMHGALPVLGFRCGNLAYCTDVNSIPDESMDLLRGLDLLILDALRADPHPTHFSIEQSLEVIKQLEPKRAFLTHMGHEVLHSTTSSGLPSGVFLAYDGLRVPLT